MTRQRQVYPSSEIAHKWAHQTQESARNAQGNFYFRGPTIYSYRDSWPLARIYTRKGGARLVLSNSERYSVTTAKQQSYANRAVSHLERIDVPYVENHPAARLEWPSAMALQLTAEQHAANLKHLTDTAAAHLKTAQRAMTEYSAARHIGDAREALENAARYMRFFGIRRKAPAIPEAAYQAAIDRARRIENPDPASADKRERARAQRQEKNQARDFYRIGAARSSWRLGDAWGQDYEALRSSACMLRLTGCNAAGCDAQPCDHAEILTSWGARVPVAAAPMVWAYVQRARRSENGLAPCNISADRRPRIGDYPLDRIDADGTLHAGCHTIPYSELAMMARTLNLEGKPWAAA